MEIRRVTENKKAYLSLLLLADEQESMIDRYLERGEMFVLEDDGVKSICVVTDEGEGICELKSLATEPAFQGRGYAARLVRFLFEQYRSNYVYMLVGTGDCSPARRFYEGLGFVYAYRLPGFFTENYDHPIFEEGSLLRDMVVYKKKL